MATKSAAVRRRIEGKAKNEKREKDRTLSRESTDLNDRTVGYMGWNEIISRIQSSRESRFRWPTTLLLPVATMAPFKK